MSVRTFGARIGSVVLATAALAPWVGAGVIVVDPAGGDGTAALQAALAGAADGDIVLVRAGTYTTFESPAFYTISGKGLTLVTDAAEPPTLGPLEIENVPSGSAVIVRGFTLGSNAVPVFLGIAASGVSAHDNPGVVWLEDCAINGTNGSGIMFLANGSGAAAVQVDGSAAVTLQRCTLTGGRGADYIAPSGFKLYSSSGGDGLRATSESAVSARECVMVGGAGGNGQTFPGTESGSGGDGAFLQHSTIDLAACALTGGSNGSFNANASDQAGNGLTLEWSTASQRDCSFTGGTLVPEGVASVPVWPSLEFVTEYPAAARGFAIDSPLQEGEAGTIAVDGEAGDAVTLLVAVEAGFTPLPARQGVLTLSPAPALMLVPLGVTGPGGDLAFGFTTPSLPAALLGATLPMQIAVQSSDGLTLEASSAFVWLDAGF